MEQNNFPTNQPGQVEPVTRYYIKRFYQDLIRGRFKRPSGEEERKRIQAKIDAAIRSGKVK